VTDFETERVSVAGMDFYIRPGTSDALVLREVFIADEYRLFGRNWTRDDVVIDVGANIGAFTVLAAGRGASVYAYEPEWENVSVAISNFKVHGISPVIEPLAVWSNDEGVYLTPAQGNTGSSDEATSEHDVFVGSMPLNQILRQHEEIAYLKMDVEGAEISIFESVDPDLLRRVKFLGMEYHGQTPEFGDMIRKLSGVFDLEIIGHPYPGENSGGMLYGTRKS